MTSQFKKKKKNYEKFLSILLARNGYEKTRHVASIFHGGFRQTRNVTCICGKGQNPDFNQFNQNLKFNHLSFSSRGSSDESQEPHES